MPLFGTEGTHAGEFIVSEANGSRSRGVGIIVTGQNLVAGAVLGKVTASGKYVEYDNGAVDGTEVATGILFDAVDASLADVEGAVMVNRDAEYNLSEVVWEAGQDQTAQDAGVADLLALGLVAR